MDCMVANFDSFPPPLNNMKDLLLQKFLPLKEKGVGAGGIVGALHHSQSW